MSKGNVNISIEYLDELRDYEKAFKDKSICIIEFNTFYASTRCISANEVIKQQEEIISEYKKELIEIKHRKSVREYISTGNIVTKDKDMLLKELSSIKSLSVFGFITAKINGFKNL